MITRSGPHASCAASGTDRASASARGIRRARPVASGRANSSSEPVATADSANPRDPASQGSATSSTVTASESTATPAPVRPSSTPSIAIERHGGRAHHARLGCHEQDEADQGRDTAGDPRASRAAGGRHRAEGEADDDRAVGARHGGQMRERRLLHRRVELRRHRRGVAHRESGNQPRARAAEGRRTRRSVPAAGRPRRPGRPAARSRTLRPREAVTASTARSPAGAARAVPRTETWAPTSSRSGRSTSDGGTRHGDVEPDAVAHGAGDQAGRDRVERPLARRPHFDLPDHGRLDDHRPAAAQSRTARPRRERAARGRRGMPRPQRPRA